MESGRKALVASAASVLDADVVNRVAVAVLHVAVVVAAATAATTTTSAVGRAVAASPFLVVMIHDLCPVEEKNLMQREQRVIFVRTETKHIRGCSTAARQASATIVLLSRFF